MKHLCFVSVISLLLLVSAPVFGQAPISRPLRVAQDSGWPPMSFLDEQNNPQGLLIDLWREIARELQRPVEFILADTWQGSIDLVVQGQADVHGGLFSSPTREQILSFSDELLPLSAFLFAPDTEEIQSAQDLDGLATGVITGTVEQEFMEASFPSYTLRAYKNYDNLIAAAADGEIAAFVSDYPIGLYLMEHHHIPLGFKPVQHLYTSPLRAGVARGNHELLTAINLALNNLDSDTRAAINQRWIHTETVEVLPGWLLPVAVPVVIILLLVSYSLILRRQRARLAAEYQRKSEELEAAHLSGQQSEERYRLLAANSRDIIWTMDLEGAFTYVSPSVLQLRGYTAEEVMQHSIEDEICPDSLSIYSSVLEQIQAYITSGKPFPESRLELEQPCKNGATIWTETVIAPLLDSRNEILGVLGSTRDVTERRQAEQRIEFQRRFQEIAAIMSAEFIKASVSNMDSKINMLLQYIGNLFQVDRTYLFLLEKSGTLLTNTHEWCASGITSQQHTMQRMPAATNPWVLKKIRQNEAVYIPDVEALPEEAIQEKKLFAEQGILSLLLVPVRDNDHLLGFFGLDSVREHRSWNEQDVSLLKVFANIITDALNKIAAERELIRAKEAAVAASRAKSEFLANMSHEIRTPLNGLIGFTELLRDTGLNQTQQRYLDNASSSARFLLEIINEILDFSKIEAGRIELEYSWVDLHVLIRDTADIITVQAQAKGLDLQLHLPDELPEVYTDGLRLKQILLNLLSNGIKFTESGFVRLGVEWRPVSDDTAEFILAVQDSGIGISPQQQARLFEAFSQADSSTTRRYGGTGLGLAISRLLTEKLQGQLRLDSTPDIGSTFSLQFTARFRFAADVIGTTGQDADTDTNAVGQDSVDQVDQVPAEHRSEQRNDKLQPRILIAEDVPLNLELFETIVRKLYPHAQVTTARDGIEACRAAAEMRPRIILMDIHMPGMDGLEAAKRIREQNTAERDIAIIALTAGAGSDEREAALHAGMDDFLTKPVRPQQLRRLIERYLD